MTVKEIERIAKLEEKVDNVIAVVDEIRRDFKSFIDKADNKYASKTVEKVVYGMIGAILFGVLYALLENVGIK